MNVLPMPRRLFDALVPPPGAAHRGIEPVLALDPLPPATAEAPPPLPRRVIEQALEEGGRRVYLPMQEAQVIETPRR